MDTIALMIAGVILPVAAIVIMFKGFYREMVERDIMKLHGAAGAEALAAKNAEIRQLTEKIVEVRKQQQHSEEQLFQLKQAETPGKGPGPELIAAKDAEIQRLTQRAAELEKLKGSSEDDSERMRGLEAAKKDAEATALATKKVAEKMQAEIDALKAKIAGISEALAAKDAEIERLTQAHG